MRRAPGSACNEQEERSVVQRAGTAGTREVRMSSLIELQRQCLQAAEEKADAEACARCAPLPARGQSYSHRQRRGDRCSRRVQGGTGPVRRHILRVPEGGGESGDAMAAIGRLKTATPGPIQSGTEIEAGTRTRRFGHRPVRRARTVGQTVTLEPMTVQLRRNRPAGLRAVCAGRPRGCGCPLLPRRRDGGRRRTWGRGHSCRQPARARGFLRSASESVEAFADFQWRPRTTSTPARP